MAKPEWGTKRLCQNCHARFYDMQKTPITCPNCGALFDPEAAYRSRRGRAAPEKARGPVVEDTEAEEDEEDLVEAEDDEDATIEDDDELVVVDDEDEDTDVALEPASKKQPAPEDIDDEDLPVVEDDEEEDDSFAIDDEDEDADVDGIVKPDED